MFGVLVMLMVVSVVILVRRFRVDLFFLLFLLAISLESGRH